MTTPKQYLLLIHHNATTQPTAEEWDQFLAAAMDSGLFRGGSEIGERAILGHAKSPLSSTHIAGYMRFDSTDRQKLIDLLKRHPVILHGGTAELCELPKS